MTAAFSRPVINELIRTGWTAAILLLSGVGTAYAAATDPTVSTLPFIPNVESNFMMQAIGTETGSVESNPLMQTHGAHALWGSSTSPELVINDNTPMTQLTADTKVSENIFNQSVYNSTDVNSTIGLTTQNERWMAGVQEQTVYDTTRTSEMTNYGLLTSPARHLGLTLAPQMSFSPSATDKYALNASAQLSDYDKSVFTNYEVLSVTPIYAHNFDPRNAAVFSLQGQIFKTTDNFSNTTDSLAPSVGWIAELSPTLTAKASAGFQVSRQYQESLPSQPYILSPVYSVDFHYADEQDTADFISSRAEYPYGNGIEALQTGVSVAETHVLNPKFSLNVNVNYDSDSYQQVLTGSVKSQWGGGGGITYHLLEEADLTAAYQYRHEILTNIAGNAQDHLVTVNLVYHPQGWGL